MVDVDSYWFEYSSKSSHIYVIEADLYCVEYLRLSSLRGMINVEWRGFEFTALSPCIENEFSLISVAEWFNFHAFHWKIFYCLSLMAQFGIDDILTHSYSKYKRNKLNYLSIMKLRWVFTFQGVSQYKDGVLPVCGFHYKDKTDDRISIMMIMGTSTCIPE